MSTTTIIPHTSSNPTCILQPTYIHIPSSLTLPLAYTAPGASPNLIQISLHSPSKSVQKEFVHIFGDVASIVKRLNPNVTEYELTLYSLYVVPTTQPSKAGSLLRTGVLIENEKDRLLQTFFSFSQSLINKSQAISDSGGSSANDILWLDYIDPCSGLPSIDTTLTNIYDEVSSFLSLLSYPVFNAGGCKVLCHPVWGEGVYPASVFVIGREESVKKVWEAVVEEWKV